MKILITGTQGLSHHLINAYHDHSVTAVSRQTGHDINCVEIWGQEFLDHDMVINCAYNGLAQIRVLEFFFAAWHAKSDKHLITIGSTAADYAGARPDMAGISWPYRSHKQSLLSAWRETCHAAIDSKLINPGPIDTAMVQHRSVPKMSPGELAVRIRLLIEDPWIRRVDLWV